MKNPDIKTDVVHSGTKAAWNVIGTTLGKKYKIARVPYHISGTHLKLDHIAKQEAFEHAEFISHCFNISDSICKPTP